MKNILFFTCILNTLVLVSGDENPSKKKKQKTEFHEDFSEDEHSESESVDAIFLATCTHDASSYTAQLIQEAVKRWKQQQAASEYVKAYNRMFKFVGHF